MKIAEKEYYFKEFEKTLKKNPNSFEINKIDSGFIILRNSKSYRDSIIIIFIALGIPFLCLFFTEVNKFLILLWFLLFSFRFYQILINENNMLFDFNNRKMKLNSSNPLGRLFISNKEIYFEEVLNSSLEFKTKSSSRYASIAFQLYLNFEKKKRIKVLDFNEQDIGKRFNQLINGMIKK